MNEIITIIKSVVLKNYFNFEGRATRREFWTFTLAYMVVNLILSCIPKAGPIISGLLGLALLCPSLGVGARRLHDINKSGWLQLIAFIPLVGAIILIVWWAKEGNKEANQYGEVPVTPTETDANIKM